MALTRAHPRSRGEHVLAETRGEGGYGSSPLARGTRSLLASFLTLPRLIPARAGNIPLPQPPPSSSSAHPRPCGEHALFNTAPAALLGSSPLAQGTSTRHRHSVHRRRLIPTRAGNIGRTQSCRQRPSIHPRSRGEHLKALIGGMKWCGSSPLARGTHEEGAQGVFREGSSPLARGTLRWFLWLYPGLRLIPTRAGNR